MGICLLAMVVFLGTRIFRIKITVSSNRERAVFYLALANTLVYAFVYFLKILGFYSVPLTDLFVIVFWITAIQTVQRAFEKTYKIFILSFDIILFLLFFSFALGTVNHVLFSKEEDFYDDDTTPFFL